MTQNTLYWHDCETFGIDPTRDRPVQFAGVRTDQSLEGVDRIRKVRSLIEDLV